MALLAETGMRIPRRWAAPRRLREQAQRDPHRARADNANGARAKLCLPVTIPLPPAWFAYSDYMHREYGDVDSDYVFANLCRAASGRR